MEREKLSFETKHPIYSLFSQQLSFSLSRTQHTHTHTHTKPTHVNASSVRRQFVLVCGRLHQIYSSWLNRDISWSLARVALWHTFAVDFVDTTHRWRSALLRIRRYTHRKTNKSTSKQKHSKLCIVNVCDNVRFKLPPRVDDVFFSFVLIVCAL